MSDTMRMDEMEARAFMAAEAAKYAPNNAYRLAIWMRTHTSWMVLLGVTIYGSGCFFWRELPLSERLLAASFPVIYYLLAIAAVSVIKVGPAQWHEGRLITALCLADDIWRSPPPPRRRLSRPSPLRWKKAYVRPETRTFTARRDKLLRGKTVLCILDWGVLPSGEWTAWTTPT